MTKVVILAGGYGTRLSEETDKIPKPMLKIGDKPILWHIMKIYSLFGINDFIILCGYKSDVIKEYFSNYQDLNSSIRMDLENNSFHIHHKNNENWKVTLVDTGLNTMTGGRLKRIKNYLINENFFCLTYGDGLANINISKLIDFHKKHGKLATITATRPVARFGALKFDSINQDKVCDFKEKSMNDENWINGGFFVLHPNVIDKINGDSTSWELEPLASLAQEGELFAYKHFGFWMPMDTLREKLHLNELWNNKIAPWKLWK
jgi:glucose-1-phosphate cytidylyltransferase